MCPQLQGCVLNFKVVPCGICLPGSFGQYERLLELNITKGVVKVVPCGVCPVLLVDDIFI
jgi:hypothetical protein